MKLEVSPTTFKVIEAKIHSWSSEQQDMLALEYFSKLEAMVIRGSRKSHLKIHCKTIHNFFFCLKGKMVVVALPLAFPMSPYHAAAVAKFG